MPREIFIPQGIDIESVEGVITALSQDSSALTNLIDTSEQKVKADQVWRQQIFSPKMVKFSDQDVEQSIVKLDKELKAEKVNKTAYKTKILQPSRGEKKQLVNMAMKNAQTQLQLKFDVAERDVLKTTGAVENLGEILGIPKPIRIESFDNSNIMGRPQFRQWLFSLMVNRVKKIIENIK